MSFQTFVFWCQLPQGRLNSVTASNLFDAKFRAKALGAVTLFIKNPLDNKVSQIKL